MSDREPEKAGVKQAYPPAERYKGLL